MKSNISKSRPLQILTLAAALTCGCAAQAAPITKAGTDHPIIQRPSPQKQIPSNRLLNATRTILFCFLMFTLNIAPAYALVFQGVSTGPAEADAKSDSIVLRNDVLSAKWQTSGKQLRWSVFENRIEKTSMVVPVDVFVLETSTGRITSSECVLESTAIEELKKDPRALRNAEHVSGKCVVANLLHVASGIKVCWRAELRDGANALRSKITVMAGNEQIVISKIILLDGGVLAGAETIGTVQASPVAGSGIFLGFENPLVWNTVKEGRVTCVDNNPHTLAALQSHTASIILGVYPKGQLRRAFLCYIEQERPRPYQSWLHYNTWYDLSWRDPSSVIRVFNEAQVLDVIHGFGEELVKKRGVRLDSFLLDDGWDDPATVWGIDQKNWPHAFTAVQKAAAQYDANISAWFSPVGGYCERASRRFAAGNKLGLKFSFSDTNYYRRFREQCMSFVSEYGVNGFKFDGIGTADNIDPAIRLFGDLRSVRQDVFINLTTGSWPSPFFLLLADATYHGEGDYGFCGKGTARQRWITYRDGAVYVGVVKKGPLYPLNSIMNGGIIYATNAPGSATAWNGIAINSPGGLNVDLGNDFKDEVRSYFASGTQLQELYISHRLMTATNWDDLAAASKWSRSRQDCLVDVHWIGGSPRNGEIYGWAAWTEKGGVLALRNPDDKPATISLDPATAFELPEGAPRNYQLSCPYPDQRVQKMAFNAGQPVEFLIQPFELLVFDAVASEKK
jgi:hypothetical protein